MSWLFVIAPFGIVAFVGLVLFGQIAAHLTAVLP